MAGGIFIIQGGNLVEMRETPYAKEHILQKLLADYPNLIAGDLIDHDAPRRWLLIRREYAVPAGEENRDQLSVDHLFLDQDAVPTLVEVKRSTDPRIRREVVGQMLDYAANAVVNWSAEEIQGRFSATCEARGQDPDLELKNLFGPDAEPEQFWPKVDENLKSGRIRLLFVADEVPVDLRRIVEFLNQQMSPAEVLAVEIKQYAGEGVQTLVPRVYGQTVVTQQKGKRAEAQWDEPKFLARLTEQGDAASTPAARAIFEWARRTTDVIWGTVPERGTLVALYPHKGRTFAMFTVYTTGKITLYFQSYAERPPFDSEDMRAALLDKLNAIPGVTIPRSSLARKPSIDLKTLDSPEKAEQFLAAFDWFLTIAKSPASA